MTNECKYGISVPIILSSLVEGRDMIDILATANGNSDIADDLLVIHDISGADTIACFHGYIRRLLSKQREFTLWYRWHET